MSRTSMPSPDLLRQVDRTYVIRRTRRLVYFGGCDYYRLSSHPDVIEAVRQGLARDGLNVAASRRTTGNHPAYPALERELARFFGVEAAVLLSNGYVTNWAVAQVLAGRFSEAWLDERAHGSLAEAAGRLGCPVIRFRHRDLAQIERFVRRLKRNARPVLMTDGMFAHDGSTAPLGSYASLLPERAGLWVDDAHGAGVLGEKGRGTAEMDGVPISRVIHTVTLSKAFGVYGGAVLCHRRLADEITARANVYIGNTPLPLPLVAGARAALRLLAGDPGWRRRLLANAAFVREEVERRGWPVPRTPGPILGLNISDARETEAMRRRLLKSGVYPSWIRYPGGPEDGYYRFAISSEHTSDQLRALVSALAPGSG